jgi:hypothetical protein
LPRAVRLLLAAALRPPRERFASASGATSVAKSASVINHTKPLLITASRFA